MRRPGIREWRDGFFWQLSLALRLSSSPMWPSGFTCSRRWGGAGLTVPGMTSISRAPSSGSGSWWRARSPLRSKGAGDHFRKRSRCWRRAQSEAAPIESHGNGRKADATNPPIVGWSLRDKGVRDDAICRLLLVPNLANKAPLLRCRGLVLFWRAGGGANARTAPHYTHECAGWPRTCRRQTHGDTRDVPRCRGTRAELPPHL